MVKMGIKWDLILLDFLQWYNDKSYFGPKLANSKYENILNGFLYFCGAKVRPIGD